MASLDPLGDAWYTTSSNRLQQGYQQGLAQNAFQRNLADQSYRERLAAMQQHFNQGFESVPGAFAARGLDNSGVYQHALQNMYSNQAMGVGNLTQQNQLQDLGYTQAAAQLGDTYSSGMGDLNLQNQARQDSMAAQLRAAQV